MAGHVFKTIFAEYVRGRVMETTINIQIIEVWGCNVGAWNFTRSYTNVDRGFTRTHTSQHTYKRRLEGYSSSQAAHTHTHASMHLKSRSSCSPSLWATVVE